MQAQAVSLQPQDMPTQDMLKSHAKDATLRQTVQIYFFFKTTWEVIYTRGFSPYANFITANFITAVFQNYY